MTEYRYYMDPELRDMVWRFSDSGRGEAKMKGGVWIFSACEEFYDFVKEGIQPLTEVPDWV